MVIVLWCPVWAPCVNVHMRRPSCFMRTFSL
jgi:hypothetical protein